MFTLTKDNIREVAETCVPDPEFTLHTVYAFKFMAENIQTSLGVDKAYTTTDRESISSGLYQKITGDRTYYLGFIDLHEGLVAIAKGFSGDEFEDDVEFIRDATGEFINRINGEFVIASSKSDLSLEIEPQLFLEEHEVASMIDPVSILHVPVTIGGCSAEMLFVSV